MERRLRAPAPVSLTRPHLSVILSAAKDLAWEWLEPILTRSLAAPGMTTHERAYPAYLSNPFAIVCNCMLLVPS
jgi:hypothetical protein